MLVDPHEYNPDSLKIIGIDPGSTTMGVGVIDLSCTKGTIIRTSCKTLNAAKMRIPALSTEVNGERLSRIFELSNALVDIFSEVRPTFVACESPFMSRRMPIAYGALMETVYAVRLALQIYDSTISLDLVDPPTAKIAVGAKGNADKVAVLKALTDLNSELCFSAELSGKELSEIDEHSSDGIAIAYWRMKKFVG